MVKVPVSYDYAVHSDFLIHWTGKDIDAKCHPTWYDDHHHSKTDEVASDLYLRRLRDILTHGLWMTDEGDRKFRVGTHKITIPATPQCCFTELKLSESRRHAACYGRLGIGVKRPFLFRRFGRPLAYFGFGEQSHDDKFLEACVHGLVDKRLLNFFKPMNSNSRELTYELYAESEWRILFFDELVRKRQILDPRDAANTKEHAYFNSLTSEQQHALRYLIPLDGWLAMIIYPSLRVKNHAQWNAKHGIVEQTKRIKSNQTDHANRVEAREDPTWGNWPIELNLDSYRHF